MDIESIISQINAGYEVTETDLNSIENSLGIKIPPLMRDYYLRYNGAWVKTIYAKGIDGDIYGLHGISPIKYKNKPAGNNTFVPDDSGIGEFEQYVEWNRDYDVVVSNRLVPFAYDEGGEMYYWQAETTAVYYVLSEDIDNAKRVFDDLESFFQAFCDAVRLKESLEDNKPKESIEELEKNCWDEPPHYSSYVVITSYKARQKPICELTDEEIRLLISQKIGLKYLLPIAVRMLQINPFMMITFYPGDLMNCLLTLDVEDWKDNTDVFRNFFQIALDNQVRIFQNKELSGDRLLRLMDYYSSLQ
jgi:hypothetical protein